MQQLHQTALEVAPGGRSAVASQVINSEQTLEVLTLNYSLFPGSSAQAQAGSSSFGFGR